MVGRAFPPEGLSWFWFLNDACDEAHIGRQIAEFAQVGCGAVCLHPRPGLLLPYGGDEWFDFIRRTARRCADAGLDLIIPAVGDRRHPLINIGVVSAASVA
jgi:hypothetical protein